MQVTLTAPNGLRFGGVLHDTAPDIGSLTALEALADTHGVQAAQMAALVGMSAPGLSPDWYAELLAFALSLRPCTEEAFLTAELYEIIAEVGNQLLVGMLQQFLTHLNTMTVGDAIAELRTAWTVDAPWERFLTAAAAVHPAPAVRRRLAKERDPSPLLSTDCRIMVVEAYIANTTSSPARIAALTENTDLPGPAAFYVTRMAAASRATPPETLAALAGHHDLRVVLWVAQNPSTPPETLTELSEHPDLAVLRHLAWNPSTPPETLASLSTNADVNLSIGLAGNPNTLRRTLEVLMTHQDARVAVDVAAHPNTSPETLARAAQHPELNVVEATAGNPKCPPEVLEELSRHPHTYVQRAVIRNTNCPSELLVACRDPYVALLVAQNASTGPDELTKLSRHPDYDVLAAVAAHKATPAHALTELSRHPHIAVVVAVAENPSCPPEALAELAEHQHIDVAYAVARNTSTDADTIARLNHHVYAWWWVRENPSAPVDVRERCEHLDAYYRAQKPTAPFSELSTHHDVGVRCVVAGNLSCPPEVLAELASSNDAIVVAEVAKNPSCPPEVLAVLAAHHDGCISRSAIENPNCPPGAFDGLGPSSRVDTYAEACALTTDADRLGQLACTFDTTVLAAVVDNPNTHPDVRARAEFMIAYEDASCETTSVERLLELAALNDSYLGACLAYNKSAPAQVLTELARYVDTSVVKCVAENPNCPAEVLEQLSACLNSNVVKSVLWHPNTPEHVREELTLRALSALSPTPTQ